MVGCLVLTHSLNYRDSKTTLEKNIKLDSWNNLASGNKTFAEAEWLVLELVIRILGMKTNIM